MPSQLINFTHTRQSPVEEAVACPQVRSVAEHRVAEPKTLRVQPDVVRAVLPLLLLVPLAKGPFAEPVRCFCSVCV